MLRYARHTLLSVLFAIAPVLPAQEATGLDLGGGIVANGETERYLRALRLVGGAAQYPVGIRPWTRHELHLLAPTANHPWAARFAKADSQNWHAHFSVLRSGARVTWNSAMPEGDEPVWLGRGVTADASAGIRLTIGPLDVQFAPTASWAQNQAFALAPNGLTGDGALRDARFPGNIDAPQRFGTTAYTRVDAGNSKIAFDTRVVSIGFSTAPLAWGPARDEPLVVGPNGGGFAHVHLGTGAPVPIGVGHVHLQLIAGRLEQSRWSPEQGSDRSRFGSGVVAILEPRGVSGLEFGFTRFAHRRWVQGVTTLRNALRPFTRIFSEPTNHLNIAGENGYASFFARWAITPGGFEVYGEYGKEDWAGNTRWFLLKPDDLGNLLLGAQRALRTPSGAMRVFRVELVNGELQPIERGQRGFAAPIPPYTHGEVVQGHTVNGRFLGSATAYGGAGWRLATDSYTAKGRRSVVVERRLLRDWLPTAPDPAGRAPEVRYGVRYEWLRFVGRAGEFGGSTGLSYTLNRNTVSHDDAMNVQTSVQWRGW